MTDQLPDIPKLQIRAPTDLHELQKTQHQAENGIKPNPAKISFIDPRQEERRPSIQFSVQEAENVLRNESPRPSRSKASSTITRRFSSPPPPS